jgi:hypothetical protein
MKCLLLPTMSLLFLWNCSSRPAKPVTEPSPHGNPETESDTDHTIAARPPEAGPDQVLPPRPVYELNFDQLETGKRYRLSNLTVEPDCGPDGSNCLKVAYVPNERGSPVLQFKEALPPAQEYSLSYAVKFDKDFDFVRGGKLPGLAPENHTTGCKPIESDGWSSRLMWRSKGAFEIYSYDQNRASRCGEEYEAEGFQFAKDRYYRVTLHLVVNAPADKANGYSELYVDGKLLAKSGMLQYRKIDSPDTLIKYFFFSTFFGGDDDTWSPDDTVYAYFDDFTVYPGFYLEPKVGEAG